MIANLHNYQEIPLVSLYNKYLEISLDIERWDDSVSTFNSFDLFQIFRDDNSKRFIVNYLERRGKQVIYQDNGLKTRLAEQMECFRAKHTVSAFLLGIILRDELSINMKSLPKLYRDNYRKNFLYFWVLTCVFHDLAYVIEERSFDYNRSLDRIEDFVDFFDIQHNLLDKIENLDDADLIKNYYRYRIDIQGKIDHGITAALLVYNSLITKYDEACKFGIRDKNGSVLFNNLRFSEEFPKHILYISKTIAQHNMWRAKSESKDVYLSYSLNRLILNADDECRVFLDSKEELLTLLGLVDTIEPIKNFRELSPNDSYFILENLRVNFLKSSKCFEYHGILIDRNGEFARRVSEIEDWLGFSVQKSNNHFRFTILKKYGKCY